MASDTNMFSAGSLSDADQQLARLYGEIGRSVDSLAYSDEFDQLYEKLRKAGYEMDRQEVFRRLLIMRKAGLLPRLFHSA